MKALVAYFSASGITRQVALTLAEVLGAQVFEIAPLEPYSAADLDWTNTGSRSSVEMADKASRPQIAAKCENIAEFDVIFVGFPVWWYTAPHIVNTFLEAHDLTGKTIVPFCTSGGSEIGRSGKDMAFSAPNAKFLEGRRINFGESRAQIRKWVESLNLA